MQYRPFGKDGWQISALGYGAMRLPRAKTGGLDHERGVAVLRRAVDQGVNYIDTAPGYSGGQSEIVVGKALKDGYRERVRIATKYGVDSGTREEARATLEGSLKSMDVDYIDYYHLWGTNYDEFCKTIRPNGALDEVLRAKEEGLIKHLSFSFHGLGESMIQLCETGLFDSVLCQYNLLDRETEKALMRAHELGMGTACMGPVGGGTLGTPSDKIAGLLPRERASTAAVALRFVLSHPGVSCALSGMQTEQMVDENVATCSLETPLSPAEREAIMQAMDENARLAELYCPGCNYCQPCPMGVAIPKVFAAVNHQRIYGLEQVAREMYAGLNGEGDRGANYTACTDCGLCETKCPQKIAIREQLRAAHELLSKGV